MCILDTRMEKKPTQFDYIVADAIANIDRWNSQVKQKEYIMQVMTINVFILGWV